jgi:alpha-beta hydrolase superfamily lysophospholipase
MNTNSVSSMVTGNAAAQYYTRSTGVSLLRRVLSSAEALWPALAVRMAKQLFLTPLPPKWLQKRTAWGVQWQIFDWSFERASITIYRYQAPSACDASGESANGRPYVLLMHGWGGNAAQMQSLANALADDGFVPVVIDAPAHGRSRGRTATLPQFARTLEYVHARLSEEGISLHAVIAHSLGGSASAFAVARGLTTKSLVLIAAPDCPRDYTRMFAQVFGLGERTRAAMQRRIEAQEGLLIDQFDAAACAPRIRVPTLVLHDKSDTVNAYTSAERFMQHLPSGTLAHTEALGHRKILKDRRVHSTIAAFLMARVSD